jgi:hypothetical protein
MSLHVHLTVTRLGYTDRRGSSRDMTNMLNRHVAISLIFCLVAEPALSGGFSAGRTPRTTQVQDPLTQNALMPILAGAVFAGVALNPEPPFVHTLHWLKAYSNELVMGISIVMMLWHPKGPLGRAPVPVREVDGSDPDPEIRTMMLAVLLPMREQIELRVGEDHKVLKKAKGHPIDRDLGRLSSSMATLKWIDDLCADIFSNDRPLERFNERIRLMETKRTDAAENLLKEPRIRFLHWLSLRTVYMPGLSFQRGPFTIGSVEMVQTHLNNLELERMGAVGIFLHAYFSQAIETLEPAQARSLLAALESVRGNGFDAPHFSAQAFSILSGYSKENELKNDADALLKFIILFSEGGPSFKEASALYLASNLLTHVVMDKLIPADRPEARKWLKEERRSDMLRPQEIVGMRLALKNDYHLTREEEEAMQRLRLLELRLIPKPENGMHGKTIAQAVFFVLGTAAAAGLLQTPGSADLASQLHSPSMGLPLGLAIGTLAQWPGEELWPDTLFAGVEPFDRDQERVKVLHYLRSLLGTTPEHLMESRKHIETISDADLPVEFDRIAAQNSAHYLQKYADKTRVPDVNTFEEWIHSSRHVLHSAKTVANLLHGWIQRIQKHPPSDEEKAMLDPRVDGAYQEAFVMYTILNRWETHTLRQTRKHIFPLMVALALTAAIPILRTPEVAHGLGLAGIIGLSIGLALGICYGLIEMVSYFLTQGTRPSLSIRRLGRFFNSAA